MSKSDGNAHGRIYDFLILLNRNNIQTYNPGKRLTLPTSPSSSLAHLHSTRTGMGRGRMRYYVWPYHIIIIIINPARCCRKDNIGKMIWYYHLRGILTLLHIQQRHLHYLHLPFTCHSNYIGTYILITLHFPYLCSRTKKRKRVNVYVYVGVCAMVIRPRLFSHPQKFLSIFISCQQMSLRNSNFSFLPCLAGVASLPRKLHILSNSINIVDLVHITHLDALFSLSRSKLPFPPLYHRPWCNP